jgi:predicted metalloprotease with PDZ domain
MKKLVLTLAVAFALSSAAHATAVSDPPIPAPVDTPYPGALKLHVDATDLDHRIFRAHEEIPVQAGPMTLLYPQWLPAAHSPAGPIDKLAGLKISANGKPIAWTRDAVNMYAFHIDVPAGTTSITADFDFLSAVDTGQGRVVMTPEMLNLQWYAVALYPAGHYATQVKIEPSVTLPKGWQFGSALDVASPVDADGTTRFKQVDVDTLLDSPIYAGKYFKRVDLAPGAKVPVHMDIVADAPEYLEITPEQLKLHQALVAQAKKLYASEHYDHYDFLFSLSNRMSGNGTEHHRSSEDGVPAEYFTEWNKNASHRDLLAHEYTHSWNGKFRRDAAQAAPNYNVPLGNDELWVYEGQTQYWGNVLAARAGLRTPEQARDALALVVANYADNRPGFSWRNVQDTTNDPVIAQRRPLPYRNYQMSEDYYSAGSLIWLAVDAKLRELSHEKKSLDDFAKAFFGVDNGDWGVKTYTFNDLVTTLNAIAPNDWNIFLRDRLDANSPPLDGLAAAGWKLVYTDKPSDYQKNAEGARKSSDFTASIGLMIGGEGGHIADVVWDSPAFKAGIAPGGTLLAVNGTEYKPKRLADALKQTKGSDTPIELLIKNGDFYRTYRISYRDGMKYPHLERIPGTVDRLTAILTAR